MDPQLSTKPLICQEMIGRKRELDTLLAAHAQAAAGQPQFIWLSGEAGLGKTRLCRAFMEMSRAQQAVVLYGRAISQDQGLPFSLFLDLLRRFFARSSEEFTPFDCELCSTFSFLKPFLPTLAEFFSEITSPAFDSTSSPAQRQQMLFHSVLTGLQTLTQKSDGPLVFILEDLHWADETSLELLEFLAQRLRMDTPHPGISTSLLILGTYRTEALSDTPLQRMLSQLHTLRVHTIFLVPLDIIEHQGCVRSILNQPVTETVTRFLFALDEGNPFFTEELLGAMVATGQLQARPSGWEFSSEIKPSLPSSLTDAILERVRQLPPVDQEVLAYAAIIGREFDFSLLATLCGMHEYELVQVLQHAIRAQLINEVGYSQPWSAEKKLKEHYQFRHALTREAIYEGMLHPERRLRHRAVAEMVEKLFMEPGSKTSSSTLNLDNATQLLAEHYCLAGLLDRASPYALQEAERAHRVCAFREECSYLELAQAGLPKDSPEQLQFLERLGMVNMGIYDFSAALRWFTLAKEGYLRVGLSTQALQVLAHMLLPAWFLAHNDFPQMRAEVESAIDDAFALPEHTNRDVDLLAAASIITMYQVNPCRYHCILQWAERNDTLFHTLTDPRKVEAIQFSSVARNWAKAHQREIDVEKCLSELRQILKIGHQYCLPNALLVGYLTITMILVFWGRMEEAEQMVKETIEYESRYGTLRTEYIIGWKYFYSGKQWEQGIAFLRSNIEYRRQKNISGLVAIESMILAHLLIARHEITEARAYLEAAQPIIERMNESMYVVWMRWGFAKFYLACGVLPLAQEWYERLLECWKTSEDTLFILTILLDGIGFYVQTGDLKRAETWLAELQAVANVASNPVGTAALLEAQGIVVAKKGRLQQAIDLLKQAVEDWGKLQFRYQAALAAQRLSEVLVQWAELQTVRRRERQLAREEAEVLLNRALVVYEDLAISSGKEAVRSLRARTRLDAQHKRRETLGAGKKLTTREMQILRLLAAGQSNKGIAQQLHISVGTVEIHIAHIFIKLDCTTRTQAAVYAIEHGWSR